MTRPTNQNGFAIIEALLIIIILSMLGGTGYYVWHSKQAADKTLNTASKTAQSTPSATKATVPKQSFLTIKEWGVKIPLSSSLANLKYAVQTYSDGGQSIDFTFPDLSDTSCNLPDSVGGMIRFTVTDINPLSGDKMTQDYPTAKQIGTYYYAPALPQAECTEDSTVQAEVSNARGPLTQAIALVQKS